MLEVIKETTLFPTLIELYARYPYNDIALRHVTSILSYALDPTLAKAMTDKSQPPKRFSRFIDLEPSSTSDSDMTETSSENTLEEQTRRDALLVYMLFSTQLMSTIISMCR